MFSFPEPLESLYAQCTPFDESALRNSPEYAAASNTLAAARQLFARHDPETLADMEAFLDAYLELTELECRHYFAEGYRLGKLS